MTNKSINLSEAHAFSVDVAVACGVNAAIVFNHIHFWIKANQSKKKNFHDGKCWMYQSIVEMSEHFLYLTPKQINIALTKLLKAGLISKGNYNKAKYDRTTWYALNTAESFILPKRQMDLTSGANGFCLNGKPIPDNNKYDKAYKEDIDQFEIFWSMYPRKIAKRNARVAFDKAIRKTDSSKILFAAKRLKEVIVDVKFCKHPATWLNAECWDDDFDHVQPAEKSPASKMKDAFADLRSEAREIEQINNVEFLK